jgi:hypothetical protein
LNVGICADLFNQPGGGEQAEYVSGPQPHFHPLDATWVNYSGHA